MDTAAAARNGGAGGTSGAATLYEKYGAAIPKVVDDAVAGVLADCEIAPYFAVVGTSGHDSVARLKSCLRLQFTALFGGPATYPGVNDEGDTCVDMTAIHAGLGIPGPVFDKFVMDFGGVLKADGVADADIADDCRRRHGYQEPGRVDDARREVSLRRRRGTMRSVLRSRALAWTGGAAAVFVAAMGFLHTPAGRPFMRRLGMTLSRARCHAGGGRGAADARGARAARGRRPPPRDLRWDCSSTARAWRTCRAGRPGGARPVPRACVRRRC